MRKSFTLFCFFVLCLPGVHAQEKSIITDSKIDRVIVFLQGAQLERSGRTSLPAGTSSIVFKGLSPEIEEQSIQVKGEGNFTILSVRRQSNFIDDHTLTDELVTLHEQNRVLYDKTRIAEDQILILKKEEEMLASNQNVGNAGSGLDINKLRLALDFQKSRLTDNKFQQIRLGRELGTLRDQARKLSAQIGELSGESKKTTSDIVVTVSAKAPAEARLTFSYLVKNATWYPGYDLRASGLNKPIDLVYRANVSQQSGEEWKDVNLVLSSGNPSRSGNRPELKVYQVGYNIVRYRAGENITKVFGRIKDSADGSSLPGVSIRVRGTSIGSVSDASGNYSIQIPSPDAILEYKYIGYEFAERLANSAQINVDLTASQQTLSEVVVTGYAQKRISGELEGKVAGVNIRGLSSAPQSQTLEVQAQESQTTVQFEIKQPYSIAGDGKQLAVEIGQHQLPADYKYHAVPKLSSDAWLTATVTGINELNLLSGEASIFFEGAYLGKTLINVENTNDTLAVSLGADKGVTVKRIKQKEQNAQSFIGSNQRATRTYLIEVYNHKSQPVNIIIEDQLPVSTSSEVTVESQELSGAQLDENTGKLIWNLQVLPGEKKGKLLKYQVKYPKNRPVILE
ncbi:mucoidy inhibitor MuiA family protein [Flavihumibacter sp. R14]|nr:mucoidy inhibitor MuiA family protein [Flavihumibacter soli]